MNKKGFLATIFLALLIVVFLIVMLFYFKLRTSGLEFTTGNIIINLRYNDSVKKGSVNEVSNEPDLTIDDVGDVSEGLENVSGENDSLLSGDINSSEEYNELTNISQQ